MKSAVHQPHFGIASTLVPLVAVIWNAVLDPSALIAKTSELTSAEQGARRGVEAVNAVNPIHAPSAFHIARSGLEAAAPLFCFVVTRVTVPVASVSE